MYVCNMFEKQILETFWIQIVNDISKPNTENKWKLEDKDNTNADDLKVAEELNTFFVNKIDSLKDKIDVTLTEDPPLKENLANKNLRSQI